MNISYSVWNNLFDEGYCGEIEVPDNISEDEIKRKIMEEVRHETKITIRKV